MYGLAVYVWACSQGQRMAEGLRVSYRSSLVEAATVGIVFVGPFAIVMTNLRPVD